MIKTLLISNFLVLLLFFASFVQVTDKGLPKKTAFYNEFALEDDIKRLSDAYRQTGMIDCFPTPCNKETKEKVAKIILEPILKEISDSLRQIEIHNNLVILNGAKLQENGQLLTVNKKFDITKQFLAIFNNTSKTSKEDLFLDVPESKIGLINTEILFDKQKGIKGLMNPKNANKSCAEITICVEVFKFMQFYTDNKGFSSIFDSSKQLPKEISEIRTEDATLDFIFEYNKNNP
jgi:hypothetical protein